MSARTGAPIFFFQIETAPQLFMWVDAPPDSDNGVAHALEHLLAAKGTTGRYVSLLQEMRLSRSTAGTPDDFSLYEFSSGTGISGFFEQFHAWLQALYRADFTDLEAEREFYHFGISLDPTTKRRILIEKGSVYNEMLTSQDRYKYYFELNRRMLGDANPFRFYNGGEPDEMRQVTPRDIREFYTQHYRLGPTTGFIFILDPKENASAFLLRISRELDTLSGKVPAHEIVRKVNQPKYRLQPWVDKKIALFPFPSPSGSDPGEIRIGWTPAETGSQADVRLLQLLFRVLADGEQSVLYKSLIDSRSRELNSGATSIDWTVFLGNSPHFPVESIGLSGIPGDRISVEKIQEVRKHILARISEIAAYPNHSPSLLQFNERAAAALKVWHRSQSVWAKSAPRFGTNYDSDWKKYLEYLEMDPAFVRSISDDRVWNSVEKQIRSGENIWRRPIQVFHLADVPYATASVPSPKLLEQVELARGNRVQRKIRELMNQFGTNDEQQALARFEAEEREKTAEIEKIAARVKHPTFVENPPLTPDPDIRFEQLHLDSVPIIASYFYRAPTIDLGLSFQLKAIPQKYYKYLPILPRCLDSLGLNVAGQTVSYADLIAKTQSEVTRFSIRYENNPISHRADLTFRVSAVDAAEFRNALDLIREMIKFNNLAISNVGRLQDLAGELVSRDDQYEKGADPYWYVNPIYAFRYQDDPLYLALSSSFTRGHWDSRLRWLLHKPVTPAEIEGLTAFADQILSNVSSKNEFTAAIRKSNVTGLEGELAAYWERNIASFPESDLIQGLRRLTQQVQQDLTVGPATAINEIRDLQRLLFNRGALRVDLTIDRSMIGQVQPTLRGFIDWLPAADNPQEALPESRTTRPIAANIAKRYKLPGKEGFPWYLGLDDERTSTASMLFLADHPGYGDLDRKSLLEVLSSKMASGSGPHAFYMKTEEDGLANGSSITGDPSLHSISYYASRSPDIVSLIDLVNSIAATLPTLHDPSLIDYALEETFPLPRSMSTFSERGRGIAHDIWDGNEPEKIRRFSESILKIRKDPNLLMELNETVLESISPVLINRDFRQQQQKARTVFFFVGPERLLTAAEKQLSIPRLFRVYPSDFWIDYAESPNEAAIAEGDQARNKPHQARPKFQ